MRETQIKGYQSIEELGLGLRNSNYDPDRIQEYLSTNRKDTVDALALETRKRQIIPDAEPGRTAWRMALEYYENLGLEEELEELEWKAYKSFPHSWTERIWINLALAFTVPSVFFGGESHRVLPTLIKPGKHISKRLDMEYE